MKSPRLFSFFKTHWRKCAIAAAALIAIFVVVSWFGKGWIADKVTTTMRDSLAKRGLEAKWDDVSWNIWQGGANFRKFSLLENHDKQRPLVEMDSLQVGVSPWEWIKPEESRVTTWSVRNSKLILTDHEGSITLENVSVDVKSRTGTIEVKQIKARKGGLEVELDGAVQIPEKAQEPEIFVMQLEAVRGTLTALDFGERKEKFKVSGSFEVDARKDRPLLWSARLKGSGNGVWWKGMPLKMASADAKLSDKDSQINASLSSAHGDAQAVITRKGGWNGNPFLFEGTIQDAAKRKDDFRGEYQDQKLTVALLEGKADLWSIAGDFPELAVGRSEALEIRRFPDIKANGIQWSKEQGWSIDNILIRESGEAVVKTHDDEIVLQDLKGSAAHRGNQWLLEAVSADVLGGSISVSGGYRDGLLTKGKVKADGMKLSQIMRALGKKRASEHEGTLNLNYAGAVNFHNRSLNGNGSMRLEDAPVIEVPVLNEVLDLFETIIPGMERSKEGRFDADFSVDAHLVHVKHFEATGGTLVVIADGDVDLTKETVSGNARGRLTGLPGVVSSPLSALLEMEIGGTLTHIQVKRLSPGKILSNAATGAIDVVKDAINGTKEAKETVDGIKGK